MPLISLLPKRHAKWWRSVVVNPFLHRGAATMCVPHRIPKEKVHQPSFSENGCLFSRCATNEESTEAVAIHFHGYRHIRLKVFSRTWIYPMISLPLNSPYTVGAVGGRLPACKFTFCFNLHIHFLCLG